MQASTECDMQRAKTVALSMSRITTAEDSYLKLVQLVQSAGNDPEMKKIFAERLTIAKRQLDEAEEEYERTKKKYQQHENPDES
jgi:hypothetical protein